MINLRAFKEGLLALLVAASAGGCFSTTTSSEITFPAPTPTLALQTSMPSYDTKIYFRADNMDTFSGTMTVYSDGNCGTALGSIAFPAFTSYIVFYVIVAGPGTGTLSVSMNYSTSGGSSCSNGVGVTVLPPPTPSSMTMAYSDPNPGYIANPTVTVSGVASGLTVKVYSDGSCTSQVGSASAYGTSVTVSLSGLPVGGTPLYAKSVMTSSATESSCSGLLMTYVRNAPPVPTGMTMYGSYTNPGYTDAPQVQVSGIVSGVTVKVFSDASCTTQVGFGTSYGTTQSVTLSGMPVGATTLYARTSSTGPVDSACSAALMTYTRNAPLVPSGITITTNPGYVTNPSSTVDGVAVGLVVKVFKDPACTVLAGSNSAYSSSAFVSLSGLTAGSNSLYARSEVAGLQSACSGLLLTYTLNPPTVDAVVQAYPSVSSHHSTQLLLKTTSTPTMMSVQYFTDSSCATTTIGSGWAYGTGSSSSTIVSGLSTGTHTIYSKIPASSSYLASTCTSTGITYTVAPRLSFAAIQTYSTPSMAGKPAIADFDGDGKKDVVVPLSGAAGNSPLRLYRGNGDGTFATPASLGDYPGATDVTAVDLNEDTKLDLALVSKTDKTVSILLGNGDGTFSFYQTIYVGTTASPPIRLIATSLDTDAHADLVVMTGGPYESSNLHVFLGLGTGALQSAVSYAASDRRMNLEAADLDGDGKMDIAVGGSNFKGLNIFKGNGDGTLQTRAEYNLDYPTGGIALADFNADGKKDVAGFCTSSAYNTSVTLNNGSGLFPTTTPQNALQSWLYSIAAGDIDGDGKPDVIVALSGNKVAVSYGNGTTVEPAEYFSTSSLSAMIVQVADLNGDGKPDFLVTSGGTGFGVMTQN
ncbi:MAG: VCBS repeat-containing protein [Bdellovibrionales bacterium]|nr:VCBS repeat-containing protein [Bdellovibrionales bacterium]